MQNNFTVHNTSFGKPSITADCLIISVYPHIISFCEIDSTSQQILYISHYQTEETKTHLLVEHLMNSANHFQVNKRKYRQVLINFFTPYFTLCPSNFYHPDARRNLLEFNVGSVQPQVILTDDITSDVKLIYAIDEQLQSILNQLFPNHQLLHSVSVLTKLMLTAEEFKKEDLCISVHQHQIEVVLKQNQKLLLANQYSISTIEDSLYFILFIIEQYQLTPTAVRLTIVGNIDVDSPLVVTLKKYVKHVRLATGNKKINWQMMEGMPQHYNYSLINRLFCE